MDLIIATLFFIGISLIIFILKLVCAEHQRGKVYLEEKIIEAGGKNIQITAKYLPPLISPCSLYGAVSRRLR